MEISGGAEYRLWNRISRLSPEAVWLLSRCVVAIRNEVSVFEAYCTICGESQIVFLFVAYSDTTDTKRTQSPFVWR